MTDKRKTKGRRLSHEILGMIALSALLALLLFLILSGVTTAVVETYCFDHDIPMTEFDWMDVDRWIFSLSTLISVCTFSILFLCLLNDRIAYIRKITRGIDALRAGKENTQLPVEGNNELTELARAINDMSATRQQLREKEQALAQEKEQLIRALSHDIRTPLTSILAYSDYLTAQEEITPKEQISYMQLIRKKAEQIRDLTAVLLEGGRRNPERFEEGRFLMEQIVAEFVEVLEERFEVVVDLSRCIAFSGSFDVQDLRRIFDNLSSNVRKYADPGRPVILSLSSEGQQLTIRQQNAILQPRPQSEGYQIGLTSIRRIVQHYAGQVTIQQSKEEFTITVTLCDF